MAIEPTFDEDGYPTEETLQVITKWPQVNGYDASSHSQPWQLGRR